MTRAAIALLFVDFACAARSEPHTRESVPPAPWTPSDAPAPLPTSVDAAEIVPVDAPPAPDRPMTPRTIYPVVNVEPKDAGSQVTIGAGSKVGIGKGWKAYLVDKQGTEIRGGKLTIISVSDRITRATSALPSHALPQGVQAHMNSN